MHLAYSETYRPTEKQKFAIGLKNLLPVKLQTLCKPFYGDYVIGHEMLSLKFLKT